MPPPQEHQQSTEIVQSTVQWGEWTPDLDGPGQITDVPAGFDFDWTVPMRRAGKKAAGRIFDGRTWDQFPNRPLTP